jgi:SAM-dependent methyltransferase
MENAWNRMEYTGLDMNIFFEIHSGLPRQGPGDNASTAKAWSMICPAPHDPLILDMGCGPGMGTMELARLSGGLVVAVDNHLPFLAELRESARKRGIAGRIPRCGASMFDPPFPDGTFDIVWSEGAIYIMGFENGLRSWKRLLKPGGILAVTEAVWLRSDPPPADLAEFWNAGYPAMGTVEANLKNIEAAGYRSLGHFVLPASSWWDHYYRPIEAKLPDLREKYRGDAEAEAFLDMEELEIGMFRRYSDWYSYAFFVLRRESC